MANRTRRPRGRRRSARAAGERLGQAPLAPTLLGLTGLGLAGLLGVADAAGAQVVGQGGALGLGTRVNGVEGGSCGVGLCGVSGGTGAGTNLFHRFSSFDTRGGVAGVRFENGGYRNVFVGVTSPAGSTIDKAISLSSPGSLYWLSPGGIAISGAGGFQNVQQLTLSTATGLRFGDGSLFDAARTTAAQVALLSGRPLVGPAGLVTQQATLESLGLEANGDLSLDGGTLTVEAGLLLDAQGGNVVLQAAGLEAPGGTIDVFGQSISLRGSELTVSAAEGGGQVRVGGDYLGQNPEVPNAKRVSLDAGSTIRADALQKGDGGRVIVWSDERTEFAGQISARGGEQGGNGGFVETSSAQQLIVTGRVSTAAPAGEAGQWLLDPEDTTIASEGDAAASESSEGDSFVSAEAVQAAVDEGSAVTVQSSGEVSGEDTVQTSGEGGGSLTTVEGSATEGSATESPAAESGPSASEPAEESVAAATTEGAPTGDQLLTNPLTTYLYLNGADLDLTGAGDSYAGQTLIIDSCSSACDSPSSGSIRIGSLTGLSSLQILASNPVSVSNRVQVDQQLLFTGDLWLAGPEVYLLANNLSIGGSILVSGDLTAAGIEPQLFVSSSVPTRSIQIGGVASADALSLTGNTLQALSSAPVSQLTIGAADHSGGIQVLGDVSTAAALRLQSQADLAVLANLRSLDALGNGGSLTLQARDVTVGGDLSASGSSGGSIWVQALGDLRVSGALTARGQEGAGGSIALESAGVVLELDGALLDAGSDGAAGGTIGIWGGAGDVVLKDAELLVNGREAGELKVLGNRIAVEASRLEADGQLGGGFIALGGGYRGSSLIEGVANTQQVSVDVNTRLSADAGSSGDGGSIIVFAGDTASIAGDFSARGGSVSGDGGFIETSAANLDLSAVGSFDTSAAFGEAGTWLIDPANFTINSNGGGQNAIAVSALQQALALANVLISTVPSSADLADFSSNPSPNQNGNITVANSVNWSQNRLTLEAWGDIIVNADLIATGTGSLAFHYGQATESGVGATYVVAPSAKVEVPLAQTGFLWKKGSTGIEYPVVLDNDYLRFWAGSSLVPTDAYLQYSFNGAGVLQQPAYKDSAGTWRKLTYSNRPLEFALGIGGDGASDWNISGTIVASGSETSYLSDSFASSLGIISNSRMDVSRYLEGAGSVTTKIDLAPSATPAVSLRLSNQYTLSPGASSVRVDTTIENLSSSPLSNVRYWYGAGDDWINQTDRPTKIRGNLTETGFTSLSLENQSSNAIQITDGTQSVIFYSSSPGTATTGMGGYGDFLDQVVPVDPSSAPVSATNDGSYGIYLRYPDIASSDSVSSSYIYTTGSVGQATSAVWSWDVALPIGDTAQYDWFNAVNWSGGVVPGNDFAVSIPDDPFGRRTILFDPLHYGPLSSAYNLRLNTISSAESVYIASGVLALGSQLFNSSRLEADSVLTVDGGVLTVNGSLSVPNLVLNSGTFNGSGRVNVSSSFTQLEGASPSLANVTMGRQFDLFNIASLGSLTLRELYANGGITVSAIGDLVVAGALGSINGNVSLSALGPSGWLQLETTSHLRSAPGGVISLQAGEQISLDAGSLLNASTTVGEGGSIFVDAPGISLAGFADQIALNTSGVTTGGDINLGTIQQPSVVRLQDIWLSADPPLAGGNIRIYGFDISSVNSIFDVTGGSGGSISIGNSSTSSVNIQGGGFVGGGGANFQLSGASILASGVSVSGGSLVENLLTTSAAGDSSTLAPLSDSVSLTPVVINGPILEGFQVPLLTAPFTTSSPEAVTIFTQTPLNEQEVLSSAGDFTIGFLAVVFDPQLDQSVAMTMDQSGFLYAEDYYLYGQSELEAGQASEVSASQSSKEESVSIRANVDQSLGPVNETDSDDEESKADGQIRDADGQSDLELESNVKATQAAAASPLSAAERSTGSPLLGSGGLDASASKAGVAGGTVSVVSSQEASARFTQDEARAQSETSEKLGLGSNTGDPPTPAQIQGVLQRVMQSLRGSFSPSR